MARDCAGRMIERTQNRVTYVFGEIELRADLADLVRIDQFGVDAQMLVHFRPPARCSHRRIRMSQREVAPLGVHDVHVEVVGEVFVERNRLVVELHAFGCQVVRADDGGVARSVAAAQIAALQDRHIGDAVVPRQVVGRRGTVAAAANNDHVIAVFEVLLLGKLALEFAETQAVLQ